MRDQKVEQFLDRRNYHYRYVESLPFSQISRDANPARWRVEVDVDRAVAIGIDIEAGYDMPAIVCCATATSLVALLSGRHRIEGCGLAKPTRNDLSAYVIDDVLDEYEMAAFPLLLNVREGKAPDKHEKLEQIADLLVRFPDRARRALAVDFGLKPRDLDMHIALVASKERAEETGVANDWRKLHDDGLRIAVNTLRLTKVFRHAVQTLAFTEMQGRAAKGLIKDLDSAESEEAALALLDEIDRKHREEIERRLRGRRRPVQTQAQRWRSRVKTAVGVYPETVEMLGLATHGPDFLADVEALAKDMRAQCNEVIDRCADLRTQWGKKTSRTGEPLSEQLSDHV